MRQFLNFPQGEGQYKDLKVNVAGLTAGAFTNAGEERFYLPLLANPTTVIAIEVSGADQSDERYQGIIDDINNALVANPGGVSIDILGAPVSGFEVTEL
jgi:hypothetical protein